MLTLLPGDQLSPPGTLDGGADPSPSRNHLRGPALWSPGQVPATAAGHWRQEALAQRGWAEGWRDLTGGGPHRAGPTPPFDVQTPVEHRGSLSTYPRGRGCEGRRRVGA